MKRIVSTAAISLKQLGIISFAVKNMQNLNGAALDLIEYDIVFERKAANVLSSDIVPFTPDEGRFRERLAF